MRPESFSLNPYEVLGVATDASTEEIRAAYRQHALRWHPDRNANDDYAMRMMQRVNAAWDILKDEDSRAEYDGWERGGTRSASGPQAWRRPRADSSPGREWYSPPPVVISCPRCDSTNEEGSEYCYSCGYAFGEGRTRRSSSGGQYAPQDDTDTDPRSGLPADFFQRFFAYLIDTVIAFVLAMVLGLFLLASDEPLLRAWFGLHFVVMPMLYFMILVSLWSTTLGKRIFGLRVVRNDGSKIGGGRALARYLCYSISLLIFGVGFLMILFRPDKRGLHDLICDTKVVYR